MKKYSSKRAKKGKIGYRTPRSIKYKLILKSKGHKRKNKKVNVKRK